MPLKYPGLRAVPLILVFAAASPVNAQTTEVPPGLRDIRPPVLAGDAEWVLLVHESGGLSNASWTVVLDSTGSLECSGTSDRCAGAGSREIGAIREAVSAVEPVGWSGTLGPCNDCSSKMLILTLRTPDGESAEHLTYWNLGIPEPSLEALEIYETVRSFLVFD